MIDEYGHLTINNVKSTKYQDNHVITIYIFFTVV